MRPWKCKRISVRVSLWGGGLCNSDQFMWFYHSEESEELRKYLVDKRPQELRKYIMEQWLEVLGFWSEKSPTPKFSFKLLSMCWLRSCLLFNSGPLSSEGKCSDRLQKQAERRHFSYENLQVYLFWELITSKEFTLLDTILCIDFFVFLGVVRNARRAKYLD